MDTDEWFKIGMMIVAWFFESFMVSLRLVKSLVRCLCCISSVFLVIQSIERCSSVFFYCLINVEKASFMGNVYDY